MQPPSAQSRKFHPEQGYGSSSDDHCAPPAIHEWLKAGPFLVAHQTPKQDSLPKSYRETETIPVGNPFGKAS
jgi:hypothetical protein